MCGPQRKGKQASVAAGGMPGPYIYTSASLHKKLSTPLPCPCKTPKLLNIH